MLTLTDNASTVVTTITSQTQSPVEGGLRISGTDLDASNFAVAVAAAPEPTDAVVEQDGARIFLDAAASVALGDKVLDAQVDEGGSVSFGITPQG
ncbi:Fe-S cluster assembly protein HesB [Rathayibacter rathayi]|uniref:Fe-S cluster assembly protein HesB n=1 Tax=Rathayibacter rathayi TaxID=33887 RepID=UPI000CE74F24|nr:Fe-S cluster assembly protein HesB [Rathayibacter rathayi]PPG69679.1 Fe-S cluster assembly protein HesB [Rathayibacter rathayi]PPG77009.1 Fe-S cluster assembly protein HesB [Rathayibacter rathayi]PPI77382.1 Fe-S cluster assembly protein HesB [Rathayibacter rathayi]